jgi:hypothetical protein
MAGTVRCILLIEHPNASRKPLGRSGFEEGYTLLRP